MTGQMAKGWRPQLRLSTLFLVIAVVGLWVAWHRDHETLVQENRLLRQQYEELSRKAVQIRHQQGEQQYTIAKLRSLNEALSEKLEGLSKPDRE